jgi:hypothetical protein
LITVRDTGEAEKDLGMEEARVVGSSGVERVAASTGKGLKRKGEAQIRNRLGSNLTEA